MKADFQSEPDGLVLDPLNEVVSDVREGKPILMVDDQSRENEADLMVAAELIKPEHINFMLQEGKGLICLSLTEERLKELGIQMQVTENSSVFGTNFGVSIDHVSVLEWGESASARAKTINAAVSDNVSPSEFVTPGHVFPLASVRAGVLRRRGQTEGSTDLARIAGLKPAAVICEVMGKSGEMLRGEALLEYQRRHGLKITSVEAILQHRLLNEISLRRVSEGVLPLSVAGALKQFRALVYVDDVDALEHLVFVKGEPKSDTLVRIHSECLTGDVFGSRRCDCGYQLRTSLEMIEKAGEGLLIYLQQEGRGIGLANKLRAYELQERGFDTVEANTHLGFAPDLRSYRVAAKILQDLSIQSVRLLTNNPAKVDSLGEFGIRVTERLPLHAPVDEFNFDYLKTKERRLGHLF